MSEVKTPPKEFEPIKDRAEAVRLLKEGAKTFASVMIWTRNQATIVNTHLKLFMEQDDLLYFQVPPELDVKKFIFEVESTSRECFFSASLAYANVFFKTKFYGLDKAGLLFHFPDQVFKVQRRKDLRLKIPDGYVLKAEFNDPLNPEGVISRKVFDLSAGGLSVLTDSADESVYVKGLLLKNLAFVIRSRKIVVDAEVKHCKIIVLGAGKKMLKVGLIFRNLRGADSQVIAAHVFEESRRYFLRFL
ncbi:MAG TPA: hypothetical protein DCS07_01645 [Bdellovibrionales bacterium]|nr:MAG: hypothetical protein A2Z97_06050 [Bdellovibrionales bacterium GWB1_52_6]OFZ04337.1 MAG: hypothetical protein A2X97_06740 [Bdellovibrionales bacterium GWA1_52_35]OFZ40368.1 MAG: hypothetical protein A2070_15230 [Bdellovibrionales bacterium GWC1_52_8]HAR41328.1 hypothetical protein [Bdellovibrionales bacterium]HCM40811.1 hypothetical protein [Bdellovibrionales bacterium]